MRNIVQGRNPSASHHPEQGSGRARVEEREDEEDDWNFSSQPGEEAAEEDEEGTAALSVASWRTEMMENAKGLPERARALIDVAVDEIVIASGVVVVEEEAGTTRSFDDVEELCTDDDHILNDER
jgi:hypothetical protein